MKKNRINGRGVLIRVLKKPSWLLKLTFLFIVLAQVNICGAAVNHEHKVSLQMSDVSLEKVILELRKQTGIRFFYSIDKIKTIERVSIDAKDEALKNVLNRLLSGTGLTYTLLDEVVVIRDEGEKVVKDSLQKTLIQGIVKDQHGNTLPGVSVTVKGTSVGVATDVRGAFTLQVPAEERIVLVFSFVGMKMKEVPYKGAKLVVIMEEEAQSIDAVSDTLL
ncbi:MAG: carboxypeptidase-like regulatory domain-containing protein, partial [Odoribacter sp.]|nr:carboxypeptidase-like regulatory domain-containing protein [Odoribacter sp.]